MEEITRHDSAVEIPPEHLPTSTKPTSDQQVDPLPQLPGNHLPTADESSPPPPSRLLSLPQELQLLIWEYSVISDSPLHVNCPCDSSYGGWTATYFADREAWESGVKQPPAQPALTRVCRSIRANALPIFYKANEFQAGYCYETDAETVRDWLQRIGRENREMMREFYFYDGNPKHDVNRDKDLKAVMRGEVVRKMGGKVKSCYTDTYCRHDVKFQHDEFEGLGRMFAEVH